LYYQLVSTNKAVIAPKYNTKTLFGVQSLFILDATHFVLPVTSPVNSTREPLNRFSWNLILVNFTNIMLNHFYFHSEWTILTTILYEYLHASWVIHVFQLFTHLFSFIRMANWEYAVLPNKHENKKVENSWLEDSFIIHFSYETSTCFPND
jgi:hypothetical protein